MLAKRMFDIVAALAGLLLLAPLLLALALWIRCDSPGPVLFRQRRVGRHGVLFLIYKFRTMTASAENGGQLSLAGDARATRAGQLLRRYKLDELPQLINVLLGQMSMVGPRPEVPRYVAHYPPQAREIVLSVRPGITDWAAIRFRDEGEILRRAADTEQAYLSQLLPVKLEYYVRYVQQRSFPGDLHILLCTLHALLPGGTRLPRLRLLRESRLTPHDWQSPLISLLRGLAALQVAAAHLRAQVFPGLGTLDQPPLWYMGLSFATGFAHQAVVVFFILSGWLVGGSLLDRCCAQHALRDYAIDRVTRLWIVLLPAFLLMLALGLGSGAIDAARPSLASDNPWSLTTMLGNLAGVQTMAVLEFGGNFPLWSLAYETWYYVLFPLLLLSVRGGAFNLRLGAALAAVLILLALSTDIALYFLVWLMGAGASRIRLDMGRRQQWLCALAFVALAVYLRVRGLNDDLNARALPQDLLYSLLFLLCLCSAGRRDPAPLRRLAPVAAFFAGFSFTLYVLHVPLQHMLWTYRGGVQLSPQQPASIAVYAAMLAVVVSLSYLFHLPFEAQTARLRRFIKQRLPARAGKPLFETAPRDAG